MKMMSRLFFALSSLALLVSGAVADPADTILAHLRKDEWKPAYQLAQEVAKLPEAGERAHGLAAMAAIRAGDHKLAGKLTEGTTATSNGWKKLARAAVLQLANEVREAEKLAKEALHDEETVNHARSFLFGLYQTAGEFWRAVPYGEAILAAKPTGYPFDKLLPQLEGLVKVYAMFEHRPKVEPEGLNARLPLKQVRPYLTLEATVNDKTVVFALDTGGSVQPSFSPSTAKELGIEAKASSAAFGFGGLEKVEISTIEKLKLGEVLIHKQPVAIIPMLDMLTRFMRIGGVLDTRWLLDYTWTVDFEKKTLTISNVSAYMGKPGEVRTLDDGSKLVSTPFTIIGDAKILVPIKLGDWDTWGLLDTGAPINMFSFEWMQEILKEDEYKIGPSLASGVGTSAEQGKSLISSKPLTMTIGGHQITISKPVGQDMLDKQVSHALGFRMGALLGLELFRNASRFTVDGPARLFYIVFKPDRDVESAADAEG